jgi:bifunctional DNase/RNase
MRLTPAVLAVATLVVAVVVDARPSVVIAVALLAAATLLVPVVGRWRRARS